MVDAILGELASGGAAHEGRLNMNIDAQSLEAAIALEDRQQSSGAQTDDMREGIGAFLEKRDPAYQDA